MFIFLLIGIFSSCQSQSEKLFVFKKNDSGKIVKDEILTTAIYEILDSTKVVDCKEFQLLFTQFNKEFNLWYSPKLIVNGDTILITGLNNENGSELSIRKSLNGRFFVMDNIIKGYVENGDGEKILHENFMCVIVNVKKAKVEQSLQSECDGVWNEQDEWLSVGKVIFTP